MKFLQISGAAILTLFISTSCYAGGGATHGSAAASHLSDGVVHLGVGASKTVAGSVAIPLSVVGAVGAVSSDLGEALWEQANKPVGKPLPIGDDIHTVGVPPDDALRQSIENDHYTRQ